MYPYQLRVCQFQRWRLPEVGRRFSSPFVSSKKTTAPRSLVSALPDRPYSRLQLVKMLIKSGADPNVIISTYYRPTSRSYLIRGAQEVFLLPHGSGHDIHKELFDNSWKITTADADHRLEHRPVVQYSPLLRSNESKDVDMVLLLLKHGVHLVRVCDGITPPAVWSLIGAGDLGSRFPQRSSIVDRYHLVSQMMTDTDVMADPAVQV